MLTFSWIQSCLVESVWFTRWNSSILWTLEVGFQLLSWVDSSWLDNTIYVACQVIRSASFDRVCSRFGKILSRLNKDKCDILSDLWSYSSRMLKYFFFPNFIKILYWLLKKKKKKSTDLRTQVVRCMLTRKSITMIMRILISEICRGKMDVMNKRWS